MNDSLSLPLFESIAESPLAGLGTDLGEVVLDSILDDGVLKEIPIIGSVVALFKTGSNIRDRFYLKKLLLFLQAMASLSPDDKHRFSSFFESSKERERFGESLLLLLEKSNDMQKPELLGHLWAACARGELPFDQCMRISFMIDSVYFSDLTFLSEMRTGVQRENTPIAESLHRAGFVSYAGTDGGNDDDPLSAGTRYSVNEFGKTLLSICFECINKKLG
jgi:hypothetical protein